MDAAPPRVHKHQARKRRKHQRIARRMLAPFPTCLDPEGTASGIYVSQTLALFVVAYFLRRCEVACNLRTCPFSSAISFCCSLIALSMVQIIGSLLTNR
jgi:hypothetical protein